MRRHFLPTALLAVVASLSAGCGSRSPVVGSCEFTYECQAGSICRDGACQVVELVTLDAAVAPTDAGTLRPDSGTPPTDAGLQPTDAGITDAGVDGGMRLTFAPGSYRRCTDDLECAIFGGNCVIELSLSRPTDGGVDRVAISAIDPSFAAGQGVCTLPCTSDPRICDSIAVTSPTGATAPFTCQVVFAASSPYPAAPPAFPFDTQLDPMSLSRGVPFASVCRPPFQHSITHAEQFCAPCTEDMQCGSTGACYLERAASTPRSGSCVESCSATSPCQFGFTCGTLPGSSSASTYCLPSAGTCGRCRDSDGDLRGVGRCGAITEPNTAVDCDDSNALAYYDSANPGHAFPAACGNTDVNCNGKSDEAEQLGGADHCSACGDVCVGRAGDIANARRACLPRTSTNTFECIADCQPGYADCDGDITNGCEAQLGSSAIWAEDVDGDGRGSMTNFRYVCSGTQPTGWVQNRLDCNDNAPTIYGGNASLAAGPELCDGLDNNCNGIADDPGFIVNEGAACNTGIPGLCAAGNNRCVTVAATADAGASGSFSCIGVRDPVVQANVVESCDGLDNNCNGSTDEGLDYYESQGQQNPNGSGAPAACAVPGNKGICAQGAYACTTATSSLADGGTRITGTWTCAANLPESIDLIDDDGIDSNCDGSDGDLSTAVFVRPRAGSGDLDGNDANPGTTQLPVASINRALTLACSTFPCRDIFVEAAEFETNAPILVPTFVIDAGSPPPVRIYGGFTTALSCGPIGCELTWTRGNDASVLRRTAPVPNAAADRPYGQSYAAMEAGGATGALSVRLDAIRLEVAAPDPSVVTAPGKHAASQIGLACPARGCGNLVFRNVAISVAAALGGSNGVPASAPVLGNYNGNNGCREGEPNCSGVSIVGPEWMTYPQTNRADVLFQLRHDALGGRAPGACPRLFPGDVDSRGGSSGGVGFQNGNFPTPQYLFEQLNLGQPGSGVAAGAGGGFYADWIIPWPFPPADQDRPFALLEAGRGTNGGGGHGGSRSGTVDLRVRTTNGGLQPTHNVALYDADPGVPGSGGGGGGGCSGLGTTNLVGLKCLALLGPVRGGGGGAGGCGGFPGGSGGDGGNTIGVLLTSGTSGTATVTTLGAFRITVGSAGRGGDGAKGGTAAAGGYGGLLATAYPYTNGGHGGDGGGGGGGRGGIGGSAVGVYRACQRPSATDATACGIVIPPAMGSAPSQFITVGTAGTAGNGAEGGGTAAKGHDNDRTDVDLPRYDGSNGAAGLPGTSEFLTFKQVLP